MKIRLLFKNRTAEQQFSSKYEKKWRYPQPVKEKLKATENLIINAASLSDIVSYRPFHFEHLLGKRKDEWSIRVGSTGYRVILIPCDENGKEILNGDILSISKTIHAIKITEVTNHYE